MHKYISKVSLKAPPTPGVVLTLYYCVPRTHVHTYIHIYTRTLAHVPPSPRRHRAASQWSARAFHHWINECRGDTRLALHKPTTLVYKNYNRVRVERVGRVATQGAYITILNLPMYAAAAHRRILH